MYDDVIEIIAAYTAEKQIESSTAYSTARAALMDSIGCAILALQFPACTKLLGPVVPGTFVPNGSRVLGTSFILDPIHAAFNIGSMIRWLDFNDTFLAAEWGHPSDNLGSILAISDYLSQTSQPQLTVRDLLTAMIKAYEIQGVIALGNSFNQVGFDHVINVKIASTAVSAQLLGGSIQDIANAVSQAFMDAGPLRAYRHAPNTGSRKSWAAGDATSRGLMFALMTLQGENGYAKVLSAKKWGFNDVILKENALMLPRPLNSYIMENILFKVAFPAEFHAQTAVECAIKLHPHVKDRLADIEKIVIETQEPAIRIISKTGPLHNPADRDHCLQYMVACGLLHGTLKAEHYENEAAQHPHLDRLRQLMYIQENTQFTVDYYHPDKRSIGNAIHIYFRDGSHTERIVVTDPLGHKNRRNEAMPLLQQKFKDNMAQQFPHDKIDHLNHLFQQENQLDNMPVSKFISLLV